MLNHNQCKGATILVEGGWQVSVMYFEENKSWLRKIIQRRINWFCCFKKLYVSGNALTETTSFQSTSGGFIQYEGKYIVHQITHRNKELLNTVHEYAGDHMFLIYPTRSNNIITVMAIPQCVQGKYADHYITMGVRNFII